MTCYGRECHDSGDEDRGSFDPNEPAMFRHLTDPTSTERWTQWADRRVRVVSTRSCGIVPARLATNVFYMVTCPDCIREYLSVYVA